MLTGEDKSDFHCLDLNERLYICLCIISCKKEAYHSPRNCAQKGSMSYIFFLVSLSHWKLVLFVDWKLWLVAAVESVIHRIPKNSNQSNSRQLLHTWVIPLWVKGCPLRYQGPIGTFFTFWVPLYCSGSLFSIYFCKYLFWVPIFAAEGPYFVPIGSLLQASAYYVSCDHLQISVPHPPPCYRATWPRLGRNCPIHWL